MLYRKQKGYDNFKCSGGQCPKTCCQGWQIIIDDKSLSKYKEIEGNFGEKVAESIDEEEMVFRQQKQKCTLLRSDGLCSLQCNLGEDYLCDTCRLYPRHMEEYEDIREYSLFLSCPEVVRMILNPDYHWDFDETEDDLEDAPEDYEDYDFLLFDQLEFLRRDLLQIAEEPSLDLQARMTRIAVAAMAAQRCYDEGDNLGISEVLSSTDVGAPGSEAPALSDEADQETWLLPVERQNCDTHFLQDYCLRSLDLLLSMEVLEESWTAHLTFAKTYWQNATATDWQRVLYPAASETAIFEKILLSLLFHYFCGAVYDGQIYARAMIAVQSTRLIMMLHAAGELSLDESIYLYSREVEHSDENISLLIQYFESEL